MITAIVAIGAACGLAAVAGWLMSRRSGQLRETAAEPGASADVDTADPSVFEGLPEGLFEGLSSTGPTVVHFSAPWCGPCAQVRRVVDQVCGELGGTAHVEIDMDTNPLAARRLSVLSLPTTFIFDANGRQRYRTVGVPKAANLRAALQPLLASPPSSPW